MIYVIKGIRIIGYKSELSGDYHVKWSVINHHKNITQEDLDKYYNYKDKVLVKDVNRIRWIEMWANSYDEKSNPIDIIVYNDAVEPINPINSKTEVFDRIIAGYKTKMRNDKIEVLGI